MISIALRSLGVFFVFYPTFAISASTSRITIRVGMLMPVEINDLTQLVGYTTSAAAVTLAVDRIKAEHLLDQVDWEFYSEDDKCNDALSLGLALKLINEKHVDVFMAPPCSAAAATVGKLCEYLNIPIFGWAATLYEVGEPGTYPTFTRTIVSSDDMGRAIAETMLYFGWKEYAFVYTNDNLRKECMYIKLGFEKTVIIEEYDIDSNYEVEINGSPSDATLDEVLSNISTQARIVVLCMDRGEDERRFMLAAHSRGMDNDEYVYLIPDYDDQGGKEGQDKRWLDSVGDPDGRNEEAKYAYDKALVISIDQQDDETEASTLRREIPIKMRKEPFNCFENCNAFDDQYGSSYSPYLFDAMYLYGLSLNKTLTDNPNDPNVTRDGMLIQNNSNNLTFNGITGNVTIDDTGNRKPVMAVRGFDFKGVYNRLALIDAWAKKGECVTLLYPSLNDIWGTVRPLSVPRCGFNGAECPKSFMDLYLPYVIIISLIGAVVLIASISGVVYSVYSRIQAIKRENELWQVSAYNLRKINSKDDKTSQSSFHSSSKSIASSIFDSVRRGISIRKAKNYEFYVYNGQPVAAEVQHTPIVIKDETDFAKFRTMRALSDDNINKFIGLCLDGPNHLSLWKFCTRGSLKDIIGKGHLTLDWFFKYSLVSDICAGLDYLTASALGCHGNLTSRTCLVNDRWQVLLSDFGLQNFKQIEKVPPKKLLWTAPEVLRGASKYGNSSADMYSLAIVLSEIITTQKPYFDKADMSADDIINKLKQGGRHPIRPTIPVSVGEETNPAMIHLIKDCWNENPLERPTIHIARAALKGMMKGRNSNLMDHVMSMMESYAGTLEEQVEERTKQLVEEQKKSDILLYRMLPRLVAEKLKLGQPVEPEAFDRVTIMFSDVVSFTKLASKCTPLQVVNLLNDLYTLFDGIIDEYDVYKVETIGDGYLCVSGLPHRNGDTHAREIAEMSLSFLRSLNDFEIASMPKEKINLRIGIHTGPCVSGVVGMSMPRYCLFGDSVNTASRMESHGKPGHIHITAETKRYLTEIFTGYKTNVRGDVIIKGKGVLETYWLLGHGNNEVTEQEEVKLENVPEDGTTTPTNLSGN
uniref:Guanylate cyclase n=1 Tax=Plectus sambesii TaxID=2011161 RepID=A0A914XHD1_9BILA